MKKNEEIRPSVWEILRNSEVEWGYKMFVKTNLSVLTINK